VLGVIAVVIGAGLVISGMPAGGAVVVLGVVNVGVAIYRCP
jgi:hypothetical protein